MSGGEVAVKTGQDGETMMKEFLKLIGWSGISQNEAFDCSLGKKHKLTRSKSEKENHNTDGIFYYQNPLNHADVDVVLCSAKHNQDSYADKSKAYSHLKELAYSIECAPRDLSFNEHFVYPASKKTVFKGLLFWVSSNKEELDDSMINKISSGLIKDDEEDESEPIGKLRGIGYDSMYLVDNQKATFIVSAVRTASLQFQNTTIQFLYPHTGHNNNPEDLRVYGEVMPIQYINTSLLPIVIEEDQKISLLLFCNNEFEKDYLKRIIWLVFKIVSLVNQVVIYFDKYDETAHKNTAQKVKMSFGDTSLTSKIQIRETHKHRFTTLKEEQGPLVSAKITGTKNAPNPQLKLTPREGDINEILPFGEMIKPILASTILTDTDLKAFLIRKGIYVGNKEKQATVPLLSTLLLSPAEIDTLKFMLREKEDKIKSVPREADLVENTIKIDDLKGLIGSLVQQEILTTPLPTNCEYIKKPTLKIEDNVLYLEYEVQKQNSTKDLITGKTVNYGAIQFRLTNSKMNNQIHYTTKEVYNLGNKIFRKIEEKFVEEKIIKDEFTTILFGSFSNQERINFFLRFITTRENIFFTEGKLLYMIIKPDESIEGELPFDLESLKDKVRELAISGKDLELVHYFKDEYKPVLLMQKVKLKYKYQYVGSSGYCNVVLDFKNALKGEIDYDAELQFTLEVVKTRFNKGANLAKLNQALSNEFFQLIQKVYKSVNKPLLVS